MRVLKVEVHQVLFQSENEGLNNMTTNARKSLFYSVIYNRNSYVYVWYLVASWAGEVIVILTQ